MQLHLQAHVSVPSVDALCSELPAAALLLVADIARQRIHFVDASVVRDSQPMSSSRVGTGNEVDSGRTPLGWHRVRSVIGQGAAAGQPFVSRRPEGLPLTQWIGGEGDAILTRILWLEGLVPGLNEHSAERYIYIHGTHQEERLGEPASRGCLRMGNEALLRWVEWMGERLPWVWIGELISAPS